MGGRLSARHQRSGANRFLFRGQSDPKRTYRRKEKKARGPAPCVANREKKKKVLVSGVYLKKKEREASRGGGSLDLTEWVERKRKGGAGELLQGGHKKEKTFGERSEKNRVREHAELL